MIQCFGEILLDSKTLFFGAVCAEFHGGFGMPNTELLEKLDIAIAEKNLLKHPFYQDWQAGKLTR